MCFDDQWQSTRTHAPYTSTSLVTGQLPSIALFAERVPGYSIIASFGHGTLSVYCEYVSYCRRKAYHDRMMLRVALIHITYIYIHSTTYCGIMLASPMLQPRCAAYFLLDQAGQRGLPGGVFERSLLPASSSYLRGLRGVWRLVHWQGRRCKRE